MIDRPFWRRRVESAWRDAPIAWLCGVRRSGKTTLVKSWGEAQSQYVNCDLPAVEEMTRDPEHFYRQCRRPILVFDEVHQLRDPSRLLKIGADLFPRLKILATVSSTLAATRKFKDTLAGRKRVVHLTPVTWDELALFGDTGIEKRLYHGGLPSGLLADAKDPGFYRDWMDSFFARDIQRLFKFRDVDRFNMLFEFLMRQSGGLLDVSRVSREVGISRPTVESHLRALEATHAFTLLRPFHRSGQKELVRMPKGYGFDTGFVAFCRGWDPLRPEDKGPLWEHVVLEYLQAHPRPLGLCYWRDTVGREIDFVLPRERDRVDAVECKWDPARFDPTALKVFRGIHPRGANYLVCPLSGPGYEKEFRRLKVRVCPPQELPVHPAPTPRGSSATGRGWISPL